jgi:hypothetical protein
LRRARASGCPARRGCRHGNFCRRRDRVGAPGRGGSRGLSAGAIGGRSRRSRRCVGLSGLRSRTSGRGSGHRFRAGECGGRPNLRAWCGGCSCSLVIRTARRADNGWESSWVTDQQFRKGGPPPPPGTGRLACNLPGFCGLGGLPRAKFVQSLGLSLNSSFQMAYGHETALFPLQTGASVRKLLIIGCLPLNSSSERS